MPMELWVGIGLIFVALALVGGTLGMLVLQRSSPEQKRLRAVVATAGSGPSLILEPERLQEGFDPKLQRLSKALPRSAKDMTRLRRRLAAAGYYSGQAAITYSFAELCLPFVLGGLVLLLLGFGGDGLLLGAIFAVLGYLLPGLWLQRATSQRKKAITNGLPDALDLFIVCMEAGSSLDQAIVKASDELDISHPPVAQELRFVTTEIRAGKPRIEALNNFAKRTGVDDVRSLVAMLVQTDKFGTSIAQALRIHGKNARIKRRQRAEERAGKIGVKLVFPLAFCLFPGVYLVCIGPVVVVIYRHLLSS